MSIPTQTAPRTRPTVTLRVLGVGGQVVTSFRGDLVPCDNKGSRFSSEDLGSGDTCVVFFHPRTEKGTHGFLIMRSPSDDSKVEGDFKYEPDKPVDVVWGFPNPRFNFETLTTLRVRITTSAPPLQEI